MVRNSLAPLPPAEVLLAADDSSEWEETLFCWGQVANLIPLTAPSPLGSIQGPTTPAALQEARLVLGTTDKKLPTKAL